VSNYLLSGETYTLVVSQVCTVKFVFLSPRLSHLKLVWYSVATPAAADCETNLIYSLLSPAFLNISVFNLVVMASVFSLSPRNKHSIGLPSLLFLSFIIFLILPTISRTSSTLVRVTQNQLEDWWIKSNIPTAFPSSSINEKCFQHSQEYLTALHNRLPWAVKSKSCLLNIPLNP
jgi:hypothetical protein